MLRGFVLLCGKLYIHVRITNSESFMAQTSLQMPGNVNVIGDLESKLSTFNQESNGGGRDQSLLFNRRYEGLLLQLKDAIMTYIYGKVGKSATMPQLAEGIRKHLPNQEVIMRLLKMHRPYILGRFLDELSEPLVEILGGEEYAETQKYSHISFSSNKRLKKLYLFLKGVHLTNSTEEILTRIRESTQGQSEQASQLESLILEEYLGAANEAGFHLSAVRGMGPVQKGAYSYSQDSYKITVCKDGKPFTVIDYLMELQLDGSVLPIIGHVFLRKSFCASRALSPHCLMTQTEAVNNLCDGVDGHKKPGMLMIIPKYSRKVVTFEPRRDIYVEKQGGLVEMGIEFEKVSQAVSFNAKRR